MARLCEESHPAEIVIRPDWNAESLAAGYACQVHGNPWPYDRRKLALASRRRFGERDPGKCRIRKMCFSKNLDAK